MKEDNQDVFLVVDIFIHIQEKLKDWGDQHWNVQPFVSKSYGMSVLVNQAETLQGLVSGEILFSVQRGQLSDEKDWPLQMKSLDVFNPVTPDTILCKFCQSFIDTVAYIFSCAGENQQSMENSERLGSVCTESEGTRNDSSPFFLVTLHCSMQAIILITVVMPENILHVPILKFSYAEKIGRGVKVKRLNSQQPLQMHCCPLARSLQLRIKLQCLNEPKASFQEIVSRYSREVTGPPSGLQSLKDKHSEAARGR
ncbi:hypothetical protein Q9966_001957 [Columba livia]|nr:hypothetical protein Q9966_001957 [Columba livia]